MIEKFPTNNKGEGEVIPKEELEPAQTNLDKSEQEIVLSPEEERGIYNQIVELVSSAKKHGVKNPYDLEDERMTPTLDLIEEWERLHGVFSIEPGNINTPTKALALVRAKSIFVEAGFNGKEDVENALIDLRDELKIYTDAGEIDPEIVAVLEQGMSDLENKLEKKETVEKLIQNKINEALELEKQDKFRDALGILALLPLDPRFKKFFKKNSDKLEELKVIKERIKSRDN